MSSTRSTPVVDPSRSTPSARRKLERRQKRPSRRCPARSQAASAARANTVARAAPTTPHPQTKMNTAFRGTLTTFASSAARMAVRLSPAPCRHWPKEEETSARGTSTLRIAVYRAQRRPATGSAWTCGSPRETKKLTSPLITPRSSARRRNVPSISRARSGSPAPKRRPTCTFAAANTATPKEVTHRMADPPTPTAARAEAPRRPTKAVSTAVMVLKERSDTAIGHANRTSSRKGEAAQVRAEAAPRGEPRGEASGEPRGAASGEGGVAMTCRGNGRQTKWGHPGDQRRRGTNERARERKRLPGLHAHRAAGATSAHGARLDLETGAQAGARRPMDRVPGDQRRGAELSPRSHRRCRGARARRGWRKGHTPCWYHRPPWRSTIPTADRPADSACSR